LEDPGTARPRPGNSLTYGYNPERARRRITRQTNALGLTVRLEPIEAA
jgi:hypothetical protein